VLSVPVEDLAVAFVCRACRAAVFYDEPMRLLSENRLRLRGCSFCGRGFDDKAAEEGWKVLKPFLLSVAALRDLKIYSVPDSESKAERAEAPVEVRFVFTADEHLPELKGALLLCRKETCVRNAYLVVPLHLFRHTRPEDYDPRCPSCSNRFRNASALWDLLAALDAGVSDLNWTNFQLVLVPRDRPDFLMYSVGSR